MHDSALMLDCRQAERWKPILANTSKPRSTVPLLLGELGFGAREIPVWSPESSTGVSGYRGAPEALLNLVHDFTHQDLAPLWLQSIASVTA